MKYKYTFTVFTTTFNRADTLPRVYESLKLQTFHDFEWLFHFAPLEVSRDGLKVVSTSVGTKLVLEPVGAPAVVSCVINPGWVAPQYGHKYEAPVASYRLQHDLSVSELQVTFALRPSND